MNVSPVISVVIPVKNEEEGISRLIEYLINTIPSEKEIILMDGASTDRTLEILNAFAAKNASIKIINNPEGFVPFALNRAIEASIAPVIVRLDAHTDYAPDYFIKIIETFKTTEADIVGGPMRAIGKSDFQKAVAYCTSTPFGVGDSSFHDENHKGFVDSVYLGSWKREIFKDVGLFDTEMLRNQDDEFHYRAKSKGKKIYLNPEIRSWYYPRNSVTKLFKQYFQYGLFKPLVLKKVKSGIRVRHLVPAFFVLYFIFLIPAFYFINSLSFIPLFLYLLLDFIFSFKQKEKLNVCVNSLIIYPILHFAYGLGFIGGLLNLRKILFKN